MTSSDLTPPRLYARTVEVADPGSLLSLLPAEDGYAWIRQTDGMVGWGEVVRHKPATMIEADQWWSELVSDVVVESELDDPPPGAGLIAFGSFVFDPANSAEQSTLIVPSTVVGRRNGRTWVTQVGTSPKLDYLILPAPAPEPPRNVSFADGGLSGPEWEAVVAEAVRRIAAGGVDKVVLARDLLAFADSDIDPRWLVARLADQYSRCWTFLVDGLVGATPEMLVRREAGLATSRVLAGTIRRSGDDDADLALAGALSQSSKDLEEHEYAVRSVARALAPYCSGMNVPDSPYVLALPNVLHLATDVTAVADPEASSLALAAALHPSAAVCGTPTQIARATIAELEHLDRERYAGPVGWIDASGDGEWGIALRCGQLDKTDPRQIRLFAGCGIVAGSDPEAELAESNAKLVPMRDALGD
ncbi:MAG: Isochorismate synthase @ Menaquinone-specific isochorismate synthase [uncultured Propionibacteriaceae bacterium]|uniref:isochorismate synthase n=1 Tax=uncultured Propionibacteriaceae bacterium TaxID=257457 RepID=A0A6J4N326_9ACTN|nr:MAG: Isochorismate synthase @ Menaquinone-specific isochorismate synthase [uncultured Propionibacteriaceae bacterium]